MNRHTPLTLAILAPLLAWCQSADAGDVRALIKDQAGQPVEDAVVLATPADGRKVSPFKKAQEEVDQVDKDFIPHVKVVYINSQVYFPNRDNIRHHVYSFSPAKKFELPLYSGVPASPVLFDKPGVVVLGCNIHDWMLGYVYVAETPYFAKSKKDGTATINSLPGGDYLVRVWQPRMGDTEEATTRKLTISASGIQQAEWKLTLKPEVRISRTASGRSGSYR
jgi:hypothetical protein